jgi:hypothetical protein
MLQVQPYVICFEKMPRVVPTPTTKASEMTGKKPVTKRAVKSLSLIASSSAHLVGVEI